MPDLKPCDGKNDSCSFMSTLLAAVRTHVSAKYDDADLVRKLITVELVS